mgnify:CR=1 FL=1
MSLADLKKGLKEDKLIIGTERTLKLLRTGKINEIFISSNCKQEVKEDIKHYAKLANVKVTDLKETNEELGLLCKKPFSISVCSLQHEIK